VLRRLLGRVLGARGNAGPDRPIPLVHPPGHFHSPIPSLRDVDGHRPAVSETSPAELPGVDLHPDGQRALLRDVCGYYAELPFTARPTPGLRYYFENPFFSYSDAIFLYGVMRRFRPRKVVEVGSGFSSAVMLDTSQRFLDGGVTFTFTAPDPARLLELMTDVDHARAQVHRARVQDVPLAVFDVLEAGDILFVDSSHVTKIGSDVNHLLFTVLPRLRPGVLVHFHDVYYPFDYPAEHVAAGLAWNEAYILRAFLQYNRAFEVILFNTWLETFYAEEVYGPMPLCRLNPGGSLWLRRAAVSA
jgi:predicted O-methyltransferase YrrM